MPQMVLFRFLFAALCALLLIVNVDAKPMQQKRFAPDIYNLLANYQNARYFDDTHKRNYFDYADSYYVPSKEWNAYGWNLMNLNTAHPL